MSQNVTVTPEEINALLDGLFDPYPEVENPEQVTAAAPVADADAQKETVDWLAPVHAPAGREM